jgi:hypothetical protein
MHQFVVSAAIFTLSLAKAEASKPKRVVDDPLDKVVTLVNEVALLEEAQDKFVHWADEENIFLSKVKEPYQERIAALKAKNDRIGLDVLYSEIDWLEEQAARKFFNQQTGVMDNHIDTPISRFVKREVIDNLVDTKPVKVTSPVAEKKMSDIVAETAPVKAESSKLKIPKRPITLAELKKFAGNRKPVFDKRNRKALDKDFLKSVIAQVPMPDVVKNPEKYIAEMVMTFSKEASLDPTAVNRKKEKWQKRPTYAAGLVQALPRTQNGLMKKAGFKYPVGRKFSDVLGQIIYNTHYLDGVVAEVFKKEREREKGNKEPVLGRVVLIEKLYAVEIPGKNQVDDNSVVKKIKDLKKEKKNSNRRTVYKKYYVPCTLDETTMLPTLSAGTGVYDDVADQIDKKMPAKYLAGLLVMQLHKNQPFHLRLADASHYPAEKPVHEEVAKKLRAMGYEVRLPAYEPEEKLTVPLLADNKVQNSTNGNQPAVVSDIVPEPERVKLSMNIDSLVSKARPTVTSARKALADTLQRLSSFWQTKAALTDPADAATAAAPAPTPN